MAFTAISLPAHRPAGTTFDSANMTFHGGCTAESLFDPSTSSTYAAFNNSSAAYVDIIFPVGSAYTITRMRLHIATAKNLNSPQTATVTSLTDHNKPYLYLQGRKTGGDWHTLTQSHIPIQGWDSSEVGYVDFYHFDFSGYEALRVRRLDGRAQISISISGIVFYIGDFDNEGEREKEIPVDDYITSLGAIVYADTHTEIAGNSLLNFHDQSEATAWHVYGSQSPNGFSVTVEFPDITFVNYVYISSLFHNQYINLYESRFRGNTSVVMSGSLDGVNYRILTGASDIFLHQSIVSQSSPTALCRVPGADLRSMGIPECRFYRFSLVGGYGRHWNYSDARAAFREIYMGVIGETVVGRLYPPARDIFLSSTWPMAICNREVLQCSGVTGAVTSSEEGEGLYLNRIYREPLEAEGFCGAIGGEYDWETEDFYIEREISAQAYISPVADFPMLARDIHGLAGFGRQCNGVITIRHSLEGSTGEFAMMTDGVRSRYEMEGHCGTRAEMTRQLSMAGFAQPGNNSSATLFREPLTMSALAGAIAGGTRTVEVSATALQHLFASLASSLPARTALATAVVDGMAWGDCTLHSRQMDAEAVVSLFSHGSQTVPARWAEGQAMTGGLTSADLMLPAYTVEAQGVVDALATAHFLRTNYRMTGKTRGSRFDTYLLKYEAPL